MKQKNHSKTKKLVRYPRLPRTVENLKVFPEKEREGYARALKAYEANLGRKDFRYFVVSVMKQQIFPFMKPWIRTRLRGNRSLILGPRGFRKSSLLTICWVIWRILKNPNLRILIASKTASQALGFLSEIRNHFEYNETLLEIYGDCRGTVWTADKISLRGRTVLYKEPTVSAIGVLGSLPSRHYDIILLDDCVDDKTCLRFDVFIELSDGTKKTIGEIVNNRLPVMVKSFNHQTNEIEARPVTGWFELGSTTEWLVVKTEVSEKIVTCTPEHKFLVKDRGYVEARDLQSGDYVLTDLSLDETAPKQGEYVKVVTVDESKDNKLGYSKYCIEVDGNHNYFANGICTHNSLTNFQRQKLLDWVYKILYPTLVEGGEFHVLGTRYHARDLYNHFLNHEFATCHVVTSGLDERGKSICEEIRSTEELLNMRRVMGAFNFESQIQNRIIPMGMILKDAWMLSGNRDEYKDYIFFGGIDPAFSLEETADYFALTIIGIPVLKPFKIYVFYSERQRLPIQAQFQYIREIHETYNCSLIGIESTQAQVFYSSGLHELKGIPIVGIPAKISKRGRAIELLPVFQAERVHFLPGNDELKTEITSAPNWVTDDLFDSFYYAYRASIYTGGSGDQEGSGDYESLSF